MNDERFFTFPSNTSYTSFVDSSPSRPGNRTTYSPTKLPSSPIRQPGTSPGGMNQDSPIRKPPPAYPSHSSPWKAPTINWSVTRPFTQASSHVSDTVPLTSSHVTDTVPLTFEDQRAEGASPASSSGSVEDESTVSAARVRGSSEPEKLVIDTTGVRYESRPLRFRLSSKRGLIYDINSVKHNTQLLEDLEELSRRCSGLFPHGEIDCQKPQQLTYKHIAYCAFLHAPQLQPVKTQHVQEHLSTRSEGDIRLSDVLDERHSNDDFQSIGMKTQDIYDYSRTQFRCYSTKVERAYEAMEQVVKKVIEIQEKHPDVYIALDSDLLSRFPTAKGKQALYTWKGILNLNHSSIRHNLCNVSEKPGSSRGDRRDRSGAKSRSVPNFFSVSVNGKMKNTPWLMCWFSRGSAGQTLNIGMDIVRKLRDGLRAEFFTHRESYEQIKSFLDHVFEKQIVFKSLLQYRKEFNRFHNKPIEPTELTPVKCLETKEAACNQINYSEDELAPRTVPFTSHNMLDPISAQPSFQRDPTASVTPGICDNKTSHTPMSASYQGDKAACGAMDYEASLFYEEPLGNEDSLGNNNARGKTQAIVSDTEDAEMMIDHPTFIEDLIDPNFQPPTWNVDDLQAQLQD